jgi:hypothetical protein
VQDFAHPQARFLWEKMMQASPAQCSLAGRFMGAINRVSYTGIHNAMAMGVVRSSSAIDASQHSAAQIAAGRWHTVM